MVMWARYSQEMKWLIGEKICIPRQEQKNMGGGLDQQLITKQRSNTICTFKKLPL